MWYFIHWKMFSQKYVSDNDMK